MCIFLPFTLTDACLQKNRDAINERNKAWRAVSALPCILWVNFCSFMLTDICIKNNPEKLEEYKRRRREVSEFFTLHIVGTDARDIECDDN